MSNDRWLITLDEVQAQLPDDAIRYAETLKHGTMSLGLYGPRDVDPQQPHTQDELYVIASGSGYFMKDGERKPFKQNDVLFVEAGVEHRFEDFSSDFLAWVIFWGPEGGE